MNPDLYKDESPSQQSPENIEIKTELEAEEINYPNFLAACQTLETQIEKPFIVAFLTLFQNSDLDISPIFESPFPSHLISLLFQFSRDNIDNPDISLLLQAFNLLLKNIYNPDNDDILLLLLYSLTFSHNQEIQYLALQSFLIYSNSNIMNRYFVRHFLPNNEYINIENANTDDISSPEEEENTPIESEEPIKETPIGQIFHQLPVETKFHQQPIRSLIDQSIEIDPNHILEIMNLIPIENLISKLNIAPINTTLPFEMISILPFQELFQLIIEDHYIVTKFRFISHQAYIDHLYKIYLSNSLENTPISNNICSTIFNIFSTFKNINETEIINLLFQKLLNIIDQSEIYASKSLKVIETFLTASRNHTDALLKIGISQYSSSLSGIQIIQRKLFSYQTRFLSLIDLINGKLNELHSVFAENPQQIQGLESFKDQIKNKCFSLDDFYAFLIKSWPDAPSTEVAQIEHIKSQYDEIMKSEVTIMSIFYRISKQSNIFYQFLEANSILQCIRNFNYNEGSELLLNTLLFINEALITWTDFRFLFLEDKSSFPSLINISETSAYTVKTQAAHLFTSLFYLDHDNLFMPTLVEHGVIKRIIEIFEEIQDNELYKKLITVFCSIIDRGMVKLISNDLESISEIITELASNTEDKRLENLAHRLISKIRPLLEEDEQEN